MAHVKIKSRFLQHALKFLAQAAVHGRNDAVHKFNHTDFAAEPSIYTAQLKSDYTAANDDQVFGHFLKLECFCARDDALLID